jgi:hypothetical protein
MRVSYNQRVLFEDSAQCMVGTEHNFEHTNKQNTGKKQQTKKIKYIVYTFSFQCSCLSKPCPFITGPQDNCFNSTCETTVHDWITVVVSYCSYLSVYFIYNPAVSFSAFLHDQLVSISSKHKIHLLFFFNDDDGIVNNYVFETQKNNAVEIHETDIDASFSISTSTYYSANSKSKPKEVLSCQ